MHCDSCHDINWLHERPSLGRLRGQLVSPIRTLEVNVTSSYLLGSCWLITIADIDDREHCLQGRSIVTISVSVNVTAPVDLLATLKVVLTNRGDWRIDDREHCLRGRSIVMITIIVNVIVLIRRRCCLGATASMWETLGGNVNIFTIFSTGNANGIGVRLFFHTENSTGFFYTLFDGSILSRC